MSQELLRVDFDHTTVYFETPLNAVGATESLTLRTGLAIPGANDAYVRKYGTPYLVTEITDAVINFPRSDGGGANRWDYRFVGAITGTLYGTVTDALGASGYLAFAISPAPEPLVIELQVFVGTATPQDGDTITIDTDVDPGGFPLLLSAESEGVMAATPWWYVSNTTSTYYDPELKYGGYRHVAVLGSARFSYTSLVAAIADAALGGTVVEILDSDIYDEGVTVTLGTTVTIQASLGQTPTVSRSLGARSTRSPRLFNYRNSNAIFFNEDGNDANPGTWQEPFLTPVAGWAAVAGRTLVYGGIGASGSGVFTTLLVQGAALEIDADWEHVPTLVGQPAATIVRQTVAGAVISGFILRGGGQGVRGSNVVASVGDCTFIGMQSGVQLDVAGTVLTSRFVDCSVGVISVQVTANILTVQYCDMEFCGIGVRVSLAIGAGSVIQHNVFHSMLVGVDLLNIFFVGLLAHNTYSKCSVAGFASSLLGVLGTSIDSSIFVDCAIAIWAVAGATVIASDFCVFFGNTVDEGPPGTVNRTNFTVAAPGPRLCNAANHHYGIPADSTAYHFDVAGDDAGPLRWIFQISIDDVRLDGLIIDGQDRWFNGVSHDDTITGLAVEWCTLQECGGLAIDLFSTAPTTATVERALFENNGAGITLQDDSNTLEECAFVRSDRQNIHVDSTGNLLSHLASFGGEYGLYVGAGGGGNTVIDSIFSEASLYVVYSEVFIALTFCDTDGIVNANVSIVDASNLRVGPFFVDTEEGEEDLRLRTIEGGFPFDSLCKDAASDDFDMGAYLFARGLTDDTWDTYRFAENPRMMPEGKQAKDQVSFRNALGDGRLSGTSHRRRFSLQWQADSGLDRPDEVSAEAVNRQRYMMEHLSSLIETDENLITSSGALLRLHFRPVEYIYPGVKLTEAERCANPTHGEPTSGVVDADDQTIFVAGANFEPNRFKGFHATIRWGPLLTNGVVDAVNKTVTSAGAGFVVDAWADYWIRQGIYYFRILSNTATVLTLSDPFNRMVTVAADFAFYIQSSHKVLRNDDLYLYLDDPEGLLLDGTKSWFVDFIVCRLTDSSVKILRQVGYREDFVFQQVPAKLDFEEAGTCP